MIKIPYEKAEQMLITFIRECDSDTLSCVFGDTFGYNVLVNEETEELECTPNGLCGFALEAGLKTLIKEGEKLYNVHII